MRISLPKFKIPNSRFSPSGFTLIELLVVIAIIGILATVGLGAYGVFLASGRDAQRKGALGDVASALQIYRKDCRSYPASLDLTSGTGSLVGPAGSICSGNTYYTNLPKDPQSPTRQYKYNPTSSGYNLCAALERGGSANYNSDCGGVCGTQNCNYKVSNP